MLAPPPPTHTESSDVASSGEPLDDMSLMLIAVGAVIVVDAKKS